MHWLWLRKPVQLYYHLWCGVRVTGAAKVPPQGPYILAANHVSNHDPVILAAFLHPQIRFMAKEELFSLPVVRRLVRRFGAFPVRRRGIGIGGIRQALRLLQHGEIVGIFPEGTRAQIGRRLPAKPGVGFIAARTGVPVLPVAIHIRKGRFRKRREIIVGDPIFPPASVRTDYRGFARDILDAAYRLLESGETPPALSERAASRRPWPFRRPFLPQTAPAALPDERSSAASPAVRRPRGR